ncbi:transcriptional regulator [Mycobacterium sp. PS03-16]|uniref:helix-turn-helix domain-containing protein n=1 Tax=Mycobacterium sp. PS03-16 TaxID=2559611 RepID=UPI001074775E|nr:helix-turn-helix domain-containing protein [Mycobacterium sp. PS03-16]TFV55229.1 transcriptional regulator [Mycobacterium sp. PS03-16]
MTNAESVDEASGVLDAGVARAGAAAAARRRELDISQRSLAADGIINAGALIAFEKGRSWPRERTRAKLEEVLHWPPGTIARLRRGDPAGAIAAPVVTRAEPVAAPAPPSAVRRPPDPNASDSEAPLIAQAVTTAVHSLDVSADALPPADHPDYIPRVTALLADLRQLEAVVTRAARISKVSPALIKVLGAVRRRIDDLTLRGAAAPGATLALRLYAARRRANLTISETAQAAGVTDDDIAGTEAGRQVAPDTAEAIEALIGALD